MLDKKLREKSARGFLNRYETRKAEAEMSATDSFDLSNKEEIFINDRGVLVVRDSSRRIEYFEDLVENKDPRIKNIPAANRALEAMIRAQELYVSYLNLTDSNYFGVRPIGKGTFSTKLAIISNPMPIEDYEQDRSDRPGCLPALPKGTRYVIRLSGINERDLIPLGNYSDIERLKAVSRYDPRGRDSLQSHLAGKPVCAVVVEELVGGKPIDLPIGFYFPKGPEN